VTTEDPCLRLCLLSEDSSHCVSCGRSTDAIREWRDMDEKRRLEALKEARKRKRKKRGPIVYDG